MIDTTDRTLIKKLLKKADFEDLLEEYELSDLRSKIVKLAELSVRLCLLEEPNGSSLSKTGGMPLVPSDFTWPRTSSGKPLSFIAQIDLADLSKTFAAKLFGGTGSLVFFYDLEQQPWGLDSSESDSWKVFHFSKSQKVDKATLPADLKSELIFKSCKLIPQEQVTFPELRDDYADALELSEEEDEAYDECISVFNDPTDETPGLPECAQYYRMFGHPDLQQGEFRSRIDEYAPGSSGSPWKVLLQVCSSELTGMQLGDGGTIYFCIRESDLLAEKLDNVWLRLQCG